MPSGAWSTGRSACSSPCAATPTERTLELIAGVPPERRERLHVGPMPLAALHQLFLARFGRSFPRLVLVRIEEASGGNPFYALEIARSLADSATAPTPGEPLAIPETLGALIEGRIAALPAATRAALLLAAVAIEPTLDTLRRADPDAPAALPPAVAAGIVSMDRGSIRFAHPLLAQAVTAVAGPSELQGAHAALARTATSDDARARHLAGATEGRDETVAAALEAAAANARQRGATLDAASLYERASQLTPERARGRRDPARRCSRRNASSSTSRRSSRPTRSSSGAIAAAPTGSGAGGGAEPAGDHPLLPRPDPRRGPARRGGAGGGR